MSAPDWLPIVDAMSVLAETYGRSPVYKQMWRATIARRIPTHRLGRFHFVERADLPSIADYFKLGTGAPGTATAA